MVGCGGVGVLTMCVVGRRNVPSNDGLAGVVIEGGAVHGGDVMLRVVVNGVQQWRMVWWGGGWHDVWCCGEVCSYPMGCDAV